MSVRIALTAICTVLPVLVLLRYFYAQDVFREPRGPRVRTFLLGFLVTIPAIPIELVLGVVPSRALGPIGSAFYIAFVMAAIPEESLKLWVIGRYCARRPTFDEPMDGIVYGATAALGFAAFENALYVAEGGLWTAVARSLTAVPMHAVMGAILGYYMARSRFGGRRGDVWKGWGIAVIVHGLYDLGPIALASLLAWQGNRIPVGLVYTPCLILFFGVIGVSTTRVARLVRRLHSGQLEAQARARAAALRESAGTAGEARSMEPSRLGVEPDSSAETPGRQPVPREPE